MGNDLTEHLTELHYVWRRGLSYEQGLTEFMAERNESVLSASQV